MNGHAMSALGSPNGGLLLILLAPSLTGSRSAPFMHFLASFKLDIRVPLDSGNL